MVDAAQRGCAVVWTGWKCDGLRAGAGAARVGAGRCIRSCLDLRPGSLAQGQESSLGLGRANTVSCQVPREVGDRTLSRRADRALCGETARHGAQSGGSQSYSWERAGTEARPSPRGHAVRAANPELGGGWMGGGSTG